MKLTLLAALLLAPLAALQAAEPAKPIGKSKPNIVFIFSDDHAVQTIGAYGARLSEFCKQQGVTPNIDKLAAQGGFFVNSFCGNSLCSPSRASVLTGLLSHASGVMHLEKPITPGLWTFPIGLKDLGYQTAVFGKWHLASKPDYTDWRISFGHGSYENPELESAAGKEKITGYTTDVITDLSLDWLQKRDPSKPFFLAVQHKAPHRNWIPAPRYATWLEEVEIPEPANLFDDYANRASPASNQKMEIDRHMAMDTDLKVGGRYAQDPRFAKRNADYAKLKKSELIQDIVSRAEVSQGGKEATVAQGLSALAKNEKKMRFFTAEEQEAIRAAAKGGNLQVMLRTIGKLAPLTPAAAIFTAVNPYGAYTAAAGIVGKTLATKLRGRGVEDLAEQMRLGKVPKITEGPFVNEPVFFSRGVQNMLGPVQQNQNALAP